jgi:hypothetical protein
MRVVEEVNGPESRGRSEVQVGAGPVSLSLTACLGRRT